MLSTNKHTIVGTEPYMKYDHAIPVSSRIARLLLETLSKESSAYCILTGYEDLPDSFHSDIDFMVSPQDLERVPEWIAAIAGATGAKLFQTIQHEISARAFRLTAYESSQLVFVQLDSCSDYRHYGRFWLKAEEVLAARRLHPRGFWIPSAAHEFLYYLIKRLNKRDFRVVHGERLSLLYSEDPARCRLLLSRFWNEGRVQNICSMAEKRDWQPLIQDIDPFRRDMLGHPAEKFPARVASHWKNFDHSIDRVFRPTGGWIAFIGPDGCGKSSVIEAIVNEFSPLFQQIRRFHMRPSVLRGKTVQGAVVTDPHGKPARGSFASMAKIAYLAADYLLGYLVRVWPTTIRTKLVVFDRYFYDILVDPKRARYGGPKWFLKWIAAMLPQPELVILLNAPAEVLWSRKQEVAFEEVVRQQKAYLSLSESLKSVIVIDASQPLADVVRDTSNAIISYFSARAYSRLGLRKEPEA